MNDNYLALGFLGFCFLCWANPVLAIVAALGFLVYANVVQ